MKRDLVVLILAAACCAGACASRQPGTPDDPGRQIVDHGTARGRSTPAPASPGETGGTGAAGGGCPTGCVTPPPGCVIKGNINLRTGERVYHVPGQKHYDDVTIETGAGERWFCTEDEAESNGWRRSRK
jgi:hypothetical protein